MAWGVYHDANVQDRFKEQNKGVTGELQIICSTWLRWTFGGQLSPSDWRYGGQLKEKARIWLTSLQENSLC